MKVKRKKKKKKGKKQDTDCLLNFILVPVPVKKKKGGENKFNVLTRVVGSDLFSRASKATLLGQNLSSPL